jgi:hypothetical protein
LFSPSSPSSTFGEVFPEAADDDYCAVIDLLLAAGAERQASFNRWGEAPESMATRRVAALLRKRAAEAGSGTAG